MLNAGDIVSAINALEQKLNMARFDSTNPDYIQASGYQIQGIGMALQVIRKGALTQLLPAPTPTKLTSK